MLGRPIVDLADDIAFWHCAGYDYIYLRPAYEYAGVPAIVASGTPLAAAASAERDAESVSAMHAGVIGGMADLETYPWPDPASIDYSALQRAPALLPAGMGLISGVGGIFTRAWLLMGFESFAYALAELPNSYLKRRLGVEPGRTADGGAKWLLVVLDQADSVIGCAVVLAVLCPVTPAFLVGLVVVGSATHLVLNLLLYAVRLRHNPF